MDDSKLDRQLRKLRGELGNIINEALDNQTVIEVMLNSDGSLWVEYFNDGMVHKGSMSAPNALSLMGTIADMLNTVVNREHPILEGELPLDGSRFEGLIPPIVAHPTFTIRKKASIVYSLSDYVDQGVMSLCQKETIERSILSRENILVVGGTGSGKTTLGNAIIKAISDIHPSDRIVIIEDTAELQCSAANAVILRSSVDVDMQRLLKATMRLRPDRILVGEVRGAEALALLKAWNTGHPGGACTVHANNARAGVVRMEQLVAEAGVTGVNALIAEAVDVIVSIEKVVDAPRGRLVREVLRLDGMIDGKYNFTEMS